MKLSEGTKTGLVVVGMMLLLFATLTGLAIAYKTAAIKNHQQWQAWASAHNCKITSKEDAAGYEEAKVSYLCDDGVTYVKGQ